MDAEQLAQQINEIGFSGDVGKQNQTAWREAWKDAADSGAIQNKDFWKSLNRERNRRTGGGVVTGVAEVDAALAEFTNAAKKRLLIVATKEIAQKVASDANGKAPRKTGTLRQSIRVVKLRERKRRLANWSKKQVGASVIADGITTQGDAFYGRFMEFGTRYRFHKPTTRPDEDDLYARGMGKYVGKVSETRFRFLRPALYQNKEYAVQSFAGAVRDAISAMKTRIFRRNNPQVVQAEREAAAAAKATARAERMATQAANKASRIAAKSALADEMWKKAKAKGQATLAAARQKQAARMQKHEFRMRKKAQSAARARMRRAAKSVY